MFTSPNFVLNVKLDVYPVWMDLMYNELSFNSTSLRFCDDMWWYLTTFYFYL